MRIDWFSATVWALIGVWVVLLIWLIVHTVLNIAAYL